MEVGNLIERADPQTGFARYRACVGFENSADNLQQSRLAGSIRAYQTDFFTGIYLE